MAWDGRRGDKYCLLCGRWKDSRAESCVGAGGFECDGSYVSTDGAGDEPRKTKAMVCTTKFIRGKWGELEYKRWIEGERETFRKLKKMKVS